MAEPSISQDVLLNAIQSLFEHPEALKLLVENRALNEALVNYINARAESIKPKSEWQEIWRRDSVEVRYAVITNRINTEKEFVPVILRYRAQYNENLRIARRFAYMRSQPNWYPDFALPAEPPMNVIDEVIVAKSLDEAVWFGKDAWDRALSIFLDITSEEGGESSE